MLSFLDHARSREPRTLPIFPLRTVLFPGGVLPLKIFEQRYIEMAKRCIADETPFGVCLLTAGDEVSNPGTRQDFSPIGTRARIVQWDMPQLGILHVATTGGTRFQVQQHRVTGMGLVTGEVIDLGSEPALALPPAYAPLASFLELIEGRVGPQNFPATKAYDDASWVGYRLAELLPLPLHIKQTMLEVNDPLVRLQVLRQFLVQQELI